MRQTREETLTQPVTGPKSEQTATGASGRRGADFVWGSEGSFSEGTACPGCGALPQELRYWHQGREGRQKGRLGCEAEVRLLAWKAKSRATVGLRGRSLAALRRTEQRDRVRLASSGKTLTIVHEDD